MNASHGLAQLLRSGGRGELEPCSAGCGSPGAQLRHLGQGLSIHRYQDTSRATPVNWDRTRSFVKDLPYKAPERAANRMVCPGSSALRQLGLDPADGVMNQAGGVFELELFFDTAAMDIH